MENKNQKEFYVIVNKQKVVVTEEVYRVYVRNARTEQKREQRRKRCLIEKEVKGQIQLIMCKGNCAACDKYKIENSGLVSSLDNLIENGLDIMDTTANVEDACIEKEQAQLLHKAITKLNARQQEIINLVYFKGISKSEVAKRYKISNAAVTWILKDIAIKLKKFMQH